MSLLFKFIEDLEVGKYTPLDKLWLKILHANLKKSEQNSIERIRLVRLIKPFDLKNKSNTKMLTRVLFMKFIWMD